MTVHGYARISTRDQHLALQQAALDAAGCDDVTAETGSGATSRPMLKALLDRLQEGDELVVWKLDRLGRRATEVIATATELRDRGVVLRSLTEGIDGRTPAGRAFLAILAVLAELERETLLERVRAGIAISQAEGRHGRRRKYDQARIRHAKALVDDGVSLRQAAAKVGIPKSSLAEALGRLPPVVMPS